MMRFFAKRLCPPLIAASLLATPTFAQTSDSFIDDLKALAASGGAFLNFGSVNDRGNGSVEVSDMTVLIGVEGDEFKATADSLAVDGYERTDTSVSFNTFVLNNLAANFPDDFNLAVERGSVNDLVVPLDETAAMKSFVQPYSSYLLENVSASLMGKTILTMTSARAQASYDSSSETYSEKSDWTGIVFDIGNVPEGEFRREAVAMGYRQVDGSITGTYSFNMREGVLVIEDFSINANDVASLSYSLTIGGLTEGVIRSMSNVSVSAGDFSQQDEDAEMKKMIAALLQLSVIEMRIEIADGSITQKLLDRQAAEMGVTGDQLADAAPAFISIGMQQFNMPEFTAQLSQAVGTFLQNNGSLVISVTPDQPVPIMQFGMMLGLDPASAISLYNVQVEAR